MTGGRHIASQHAGANIAIRTIYNPTLWPLRVTVLDQAVCVCGWVWQCTLC